MTDESPIKQGIVSTSGIREILKSLKQKRRGALLVTSGHQDLRLVIEPRKVSVEGVGTELVQIEDAQDDLIRNFLCCTFWEDASYFLDLEGQPKRGAPAIRVEANQYRLLENIEQGFIALDELKERVPNMDILVSVSGQPPPEDVVTPAADLFRILREQPGGAHLGTAAEDAGLDAVDAAWAVNDLVEFKQATVRKAPPTMAIRRLKHAEPLAVQGILPAVRYAHLARGYTRSDPKKSARLLQEAGGHFMTSKMPVQALEAYSGSMETDSGSTSGLEGMVAAFEALGRKKEARRVREKLIAVYQDWAMPARTLKHLAKISDPSHNQLEKRLSCLLLTRDYQDALSFAKRLLSKMDFENRQNLVKKFVEAGAPQSVVVKVTRMAKIHAMRPVRRVLIFLVLLGLLGVGVVGGEVFFLRPRFQAAREATQADLKKPYEELDFDKMLGNWDELEGFRNQVSQVVPAEKVPFTCLASVGDARAEIESLRADHALLKDPARAKLLDWKSHDDLRVPLAGLKKLKGDAKSAPLQRRLDVSLGEIDAYQKQAAEEVAAFEGLTNDNDRLTAARGLLEKYPNCFYLYAPPKHEVVITVQITPGVREVELTWVKPNLAIVSPRATSKGKAQVSLPIKKGSQGTLQVKMRDHVPQSKTIVLDTQLKPSVVVELIPMKPNPSRMETPELPLDPGVHVEDRAKPENDNAPGAECPADANNEALGAVLAKHLDLEQRYSLVVRVVSLAKVPVDTRDPKSPPRVYLQGLRLWLYDQIDGKTTKRGRYLNLEESLENLPSFERKRRVTLSGKKWILDDVSKCQAWPEVERALKFVVEQLQKDLPE